MGSTSLSLVAPTNGVKRPIRRADHATGLTEARKLFDQASRVVGRYEERLSGALDSTVSEQRQAITAVYRVYEAFHGNRDLLMAFYETQEIKPHGHVRYAVQPLVRALIGGRSRVKDLRNKVTVWAKAITYAERRGVQSAEFSRFLRSTEGGIDGASRLLGKEEKSKAFREERATKLIKVRAAYDAAHPGATILQTAFTKSLEPGLYLAAIEVAQGGQAEIKAILDRSSTQVDQALDDHILAWAERTGVDLDDA